MSETIAQTLNTKTQRTPYLDVAAYVSQTDTLNAHAGMQAALTAGFGKDIIFTAPVGSTRVYRLTTRADGRLLLPRIGRIIMAHGASIQCDWPIKAGNVGTQILYGIGTSQGAADFIDTPQAGDYELTLATAGAVVVKGRWHRIVSNLTDDFTKEDGVLGGRGEQVYVTSVIGTAVILATPLLYTYASGCTITRADETNLAFEGVRIDGLGRFETAGTEGDTGIQVLLGGKVSFEGCETSGIDKYGLYVSAREFSFENCTTIQDTFPKATGFDRNAYGIVYANQSIRGLISNSTTIGGKEGVSQTSIGGSPGVTRNVDVMHHTGKANARSGVVFHDNYESCTVAYSNFEDCEQGIDIRGRNNNIIGNRFLRMGAFTATLDCSIQLGSGVGNITANGNRHEDGLRGWWMPQTLGLDVDLDGIYIGHEVAPGDFKISDDKLNSSRGVYGILLDYRGGDGTGYAGNATLLGTLNLHGLDYTLRTSGFARGVETQGRWNEPVVEGTFRGGDGTSACVYLHATAVGGAGNGAVSPTIDVKFTSGYLAPVLQHGTGTAKVQFQGIGHVATGEILLGSPALTVAYADDTAAGIGGVLVGQPYKVTGGNIAWRVA